MMNQEQRRRRNAEYQRAYRQRQNGKRAAAAVKAAASILQTLDIDPRGHPQVIEIARRLLSLSAKRTK